VSLLALGRLCDMTWSSTLLLAILNERLEEFNGLLADVTLMILLLESLELVLVSSFAGICGLG
jgi:hypothetical protein